MGRIAQIDFWYYTQNMNATARPVSRTLQASGTLLVLSLLASASVRADDAAFERDVAPILSRRCLSCHNEDQHKGGLSLQTRAAALKGGESGAVIVPGDADSSYLLDLITPEQGRAVMPKDADPLSADDVAALRRWISAGAAWPESLRLKEHRIADTDWWSLRTLTRPPLPNVAPSLRERDPTAEEPVSTDWTRNPIDAFIAAKHAEHGFSPAPQADRRTLIRRLSYDLTGLPPTRDEVAAFRDDADPRAYERLVDRLLDSPHYGERWARHWLDVVHYGDTHGYDKDKPRPNAWPYRDYVIRSLNGDKPYARFSREQIAGDVLYPDDADGIIATGLIAAGPWDFISHVEVPENKIDGRIARSIDRDDMVRTVMETFCSVTVGCARCHHHKFDPVTQQDYYNLQSVFAAVDRADRPYDADPAVQRRRQQLAAQQHELPQRQAALDADVQRIAGDALKPIDGQIAALEQRQRDTRERPEFGYHSAIDREQNGTKWVQVDLGEPTEIARIVYVACHDDFNHIGAGFGFPVRYRIEASNDAEFRAGVVMFSDRTEEDVPNPGTTPLTLDPPPSTPPQRYVRVTATKLAPRQNDYILALAELSVLTPDGTNVALGKPVTALDSIEAPVRWGKSNLVDGYYHGVARDPSVKDQIASLRERRRALLERALPPELQRDLADVERRLADVQSQTSQLPTPSQVYAAATHFAPSGSFHATGGKPREVRVLHRGNILDARESAVPGALAMLTHLPARFDLAADHMEGARRAALADWIAHPDNPLTWRSIVNRVWQHHFGRGLVDTPNDFGRMGATPTHAELLDWLALEFRDHGGSLKHLHRLICTSATYRQESRDQSGGSREKRRQESGVRSQGIQPATGSLASPIDQPSTINHQPASDPDNLFLSRFPRRRLEAEAVRDAVLFVSGRLDLAMYGPGFQDFVIDKPEHSPHYEYHRHDPEDPRAHRRSIYRFIVRSQQQPFMTTLDCADPSMQVDKRNETVTPQQALALLNNRLIVAMSRHFAARVEELADSPEQRVAAAVHLALSRDPTLEESAVLAQHAAQYGLANTCRLILNLNEFVFVD